MEKFLQLKINTDRRERQNSVTYHLFTWHLNGYQVVQNLHFDMFGSIHWNKFQVRFVASNTKSLAKHSLFDCWVKKNGPIIKFQIALVTLLLNEILWLQLVVN